jgi:hypothetical protein
MAFEGGSIVLLTTAQLAEPAGPVTQYTRVKGDTSGQTYQFDAAMTGSATLEAGADYIALNNMSATFGSVIGHDAAASVTVLGTGSQGTAGDVSITNLTSTTKYAVQWRGNWYPLTSTGLGAKAVDLVAAAQTAIAGSELGETSATGLINDEIYNVFIVGTLAAGDDIGTGGDIVNGGKNAIADISALTGNNAAAALVAGSADATSGTTIIFILPEAMTATTATGVAVADNVTFTTASGLWTTSGKANESNSLLSAEVGTRLITVFGKHASFALTLTFTT